MPFANSAGLLPLLLSALCALAAGGSRCRSVISAFGLATARCEPFYSMRCLGAPHPLRDAGLSRLCNPPQPSPPLRSHKPKRRGFFRSISHHRTILLQPDWSNPVSASGRELLPIDSSLAKEAIWAGVYAFRQAGFKTEAALARIAPLYGITQRKLSRLAYDEPCRLSPCEMQLIKRGRILAMHWLASFHDHLAEHWRAVADTHEQIRLGQQQFRETITWAKARPNVQKSTA